MIYFENVKITSDKKLNFTVKSTETTVFITQVDVTTQDYYNVEDSYKYSIVPAIVKVEDPSKVYVANEGTDEEYEHFGTEFSYEADLTEIEMINSEAEEKAFNLNKDLIILTAETQEDTTNAIVDCCNKKPAVGMAYYKYCLFNKALGYLKTFCDDCTVNKDFIDFILKHNALDLAISCGRVDVAIKLWNWFYNKDVKTVITKNCGCHG